PKVAIDRTTHASNFYHTGFVHYPWKSKSQNDPELPVETTIDDDVMSMAGLYFLIQFPKANENLESQLKGVLQFLGEEGIGGERSSGAGRFCLEWDELPPPWQKVIEFSKTQANYQHGLLSLFWEKDLSSAWITDSDRYALQERGGWIVSPFSGRQQRRKALQMFTEGSVFSTLPQGNLADVTPYDHQGKPKFTQHSVYRNGFALSLPVHP
ncbi:MAG: type III-A CRISPR-associated RAMP protein Csm4, partial [Cyanothece sp. SIO2G6]|nr:type III-A CRISPR-associated RAMP protein Csm4 [Cyanothece sp. SIO2G6]